MTKNITFSVDETLLEVARAAAKAEGSSLNEQFRLWLESYARKRQAQRAMEVVEHIRKNYQMTGPKLTRDEMNARR
ncbi:MAG: hypothetical protein JWQ90_1767 [Hydrocarboniphaga sp.]|uniref:hypothetical protein n=1 Tax=Hydrocarboniphaga sp. TaxID=2033016 RepID=UPI002627C724|nr:hypothetical protein [Hydrocarboniphaga sp.]MDB5969317.1 hypothetical protein [Hydrocarboniphaga sp.]